MAEDSAQISEGTYQQFLDHFRQTVQNAAVSLQQISEDDARKSATGDWSAKQVVGHLIDSAANNHQRFVRAQYTDHLAFPGYDGDQWVDAQKYNDEAWADLIDLWRAYNLHLVRIVSLIPDEALTRQRVEHSLEQIAFKTVAQSEPTTLEYFIRDYLDHLKHHLEQIWRQPWHRPTKN